MMKINVYIYAYKGFNDDSVYTFADGNWMNATSTAIIIVFGFVARI